MNVHRGTAATSLIDVLDRVLDKGVVIDAWVRVSVVGIDLITVEARVVVASFETYFKYFEALGCRVPQELTVKQLARDVQLQLAFGAPSVPPTDISSERRRRSVPVGDTARQRRRRA